MVQTELRFVRLLEDIDKAQEELFDLGGEENSINDDCWDDDKSCYTQGGNLTEEAQMRLEEIDFEATVQDITLTKIREEMALTEDQFEYMRDSAIQNRWEIYANFMGADIISLKDIANGRA